MNEGIPMSNSTVTTNDLETALAIATPYQRDLLERIRPLIGQEEALDFEWPDGPDGELHVKAGARELSLPNTGPDPFAPGSSDEPPARSMAPPCEECGVQLPMHAPGCSSRPVSAVAPAAVDRKLAAAIDGDAEGGVEPVST